MFFKSVLVELGDFLIFDMGLRKKRRKVVVHHTPTGGSTVVVAISVPLPYDIAYCIYKEAQRKDIFRVWEK